MSFSRLLSPSSHSALEIAGGALVMMLPLALGLGPAGIAAGVAIGALMIGLGVAGTASEGRGSLPLSAHAAYDRGIVLGLLATAAIFALATEPGAAAFFGLAALAQAALAGSTRYSEARA